MTWNALLTKHVFKEIVLTHAFTTTRVDKMPYAAQNHTRLFAHVWKITREIPTIVVTPMSAFKMRIAHLHQNAPKRSALIHVHVLNMRIVHPRSTRAYVSARLVIQEILMDPSVSQLVSMCN